MGKPEWLERVETERANDREMQRHNNDHHNRVTRTLDEHLAHVAGRKRADVPRHEQPTGREGQLDSNGHRIGPLRARLELLDERTAKWATGRCTWFCGDQQCPSACNEQQRTEEQER